jgi:hypothetical protein
MEVATIKNVGMGLHGLSPLVLGDGFRPARIKATKMASC